MRACPVPVPSKRKTSGTVQALEGALGTGVPWHGGTVGGTQGTVGP
jgi:hypothetical protein